MTKKSYQAPQLSVYGAVENLTHQGGGDRIDVPYGTPAPAGTTIGDVTGNKYGSP